MGTMNAERLFVVARAIRADMQKTASVESLQKLRDALQQQVSQPQQPQFQQQVAGHRKGLVGALGKASSNDFNPMWRQLVAELHFDGFLGQSLADRIEDIFNRNQITPSAAHQEVATIFDELSKKNAMMVSLTDALGFFGIGAEKLAAGTCEVGILIPRAYVKNRLEEFGAEIEELNKIFGVFQELATGQRESPTIRGISSSDLVVFLEASALVAALIAATLERIVELYKKLLEIRKLHGELAKAGVPQENLKGVEDFANKFMDEGIESAATEILGGYQGRGDKGRSHELSIEFRSSMKKLANRIDRGFNLSIRASEEPIPDPKKKEELASHLDVVKAKERLMSFVKVAGPPILSLNAAEEGKKPRK